MVKAGNLTHFSIPFSKEVFYTMYYRHLLEDSDEEPEDALRFWTRHHVEENMKKTNNTFESFYYWLKMTYDEDMNTLTIGKHSVDELETCLIINQTPELLLLDVWWLFDFDRPLFCCGRYITIIDKKTGIMKKYSHPLSIDEVSGEYRYPMFSVELLKAYEKMFGYGEALNELFNEE